MHSLVGTDSVHTTAVACDYLADRTDTDDAVTVVAVVPSDDDPATKRDCEEALNVAIVRLTSVGSVETTLKHGDPATVLLETAADVGADELVIGTHSGRPDASAAVGSTANAILADADVPVVVVPVPKL